MRFESLVNVKSDEDCALIAEKFQASYPYPHLCIDGFFTESFIQELSADFPQRSDPEYIRFCMEDGNRAGDNYANGEVDSFPRAFKQLDALSSDPEFRVYLSRLTGIDDLEFDPGYNGGGLRESRSKAFLPVHLDFNYHPKTLSHRRLNFLLYLNPVWEESWGGNIQVHLDPKVHREKSLVSSFAPLLNRVFIFETSESSWHGFDRLDPPDGIARRAWSIYYYTKDRDNAAEIKRRNTEYVEPFLPATLSPGHVLSGEDVQLLQDLLKRRDDRIAMLYELRRTFDDRYSHLWNEYEYYLGKYRESQGDADPQ
ncbi:MAG: 2OG-Fe(II) oxygenase [Luteimonas sp.]